MILWVWPVRCRGAFLRSSSEGVVLTSADIRKLDKLRYKNIMKVFVVNRALLLEIELQAYSECRDMLLDFATRGEDHSVKFVHLWQKSFCFQGKTEKSPKYYRFKIFFAFSGEQYTPCFHFCRRIIFSYQDSVLLILHCN